MTKRPNRRKGQQRVANPCARYPRGKKYHDYRKLFDEMDREIEAEGPPSQAVLARCSDVGPGVEAQ